MPPWNKATATRFAISQIEQHRQKCVATSYAHVPASWTSDCIALLLIERHLLVEFKTRIHTSALQMRDVCGLRPDAKEKVGGGNVSVVQDQKKRKNKHNQHDVQRQRQLKQQHDNQKTALCMTNKKEEQTHSMTCSGSSS